MLPRTVEKLLELFDVPLSAQYTHCQRKQHCSWPLYALLMLHQYLPQHRKDYSDDDETRDWYARLGHLAILDGLMQRQFERIRSCKETREIERREGEEDVEEASGPIATPAR